jgi:hypothetical protein
MCDIHRVASVVTCSYVTMDILLAYNTNLLSSMERPCRVCETCLN